MTAADTAPPIRLDRYLALLAVLLALVLGLLIMSEREKQPRGLPAVVGTLPPSSDPRLTALTAEHEGLLAEQARLAAALAAAETALGRAQAEAEALTEENQRLRQLLGDEGAALDDLAGRLAAAEQERDRLGAEVQRLTLTVQALEVRLAELEAAGAAAPVPNPSTASSTDPSTGALGVEPAEPPAPEPSTIPRRILDPTGTAEPTPAPTESGAPDAAAGPAGAPRRLTTFGTGTGGTGTGGTILGNAGELTVADGIAAYSAGDYTAAETIWGRLAAAGDRRAQFHFGSILFEGRNAAPDAVMAHVWLSRAVDAGYLPAIEVRRRVRAAMSEAEYEEAMAIQEGG